MQLQDMSLPAPANVPGGPPARQGRPSPLAANPAARVKVIVNPVSGHKAGITTNAAGRAEVQAALDATGIRADVFETQAPEDGTVLALEGLDEHYDLVVACGGDGTVDDVAAALIDTPQILGIVPLGSANNVARMLHVPFDLEGAVRLLCEGEVHCIDVGRVGDRIFLETAGVGLDAALFPLLNQLDHGAYFTLLEAARTFLRWRPVRMSLWLDGRRLRVRATMVLVANGPYWGYSVPLAPDAKVNDHRLDVLVFENFSKWDLVRHVVASFLGRGQARDPATGQAINRRVYHPRVRTYQARVVKITSRRRLPVHGDARPVGHTPITISIKTNALNVITGRGEHVTV